MAALPPALAEVVAAFNVCGIAVAPVTNIIASQGFTSMENFNDLEDDDEVEILALRLVKCPAGNGVFFLDMFRLRVFRCLLGGCVIAQNKTCLLMALTLLH
jgi:hypothetical protein